MLYQKFVKQTHTKIQKTHRLFALIAFTGLFFYQHLAYSQQYVTVDRENGDRFTGTWRGLPKHTLKLNMTDRFYGYR